jgi:hypothetical protein
MRRYAQIENKIVISILTSDYPPSFEGYTDITALSPSPAIGWSWDGEKFIDPNPVTIWPSDQNGLIVWHMYDSKTGAYCGSTSQKTTEHVTPVVPPRCRADQVPVWVSNHWELKQFSEVLKEA